MLLSARTPAIFLSYRRTDTGGYAGRLAEELAARFGEGSVFQDISAITPGSDFSHAIDKAIAHCQVLIVLIGDTWLAERDAGGRLRLHDPQDFVHMEVAAALKVRRVVIPVLVERAKMPAVNDLPPELESFARLQALELSDTRWEYDVERLVAAIRNLRVGGRGRGRRRMLAWAGAAAAVTVGAGAYLSIGQQLDVAGRWNWPNGSYWVIVQEGRHLAIEETHYDSKQVWKRGTGTLHEDRLEFSLEFVYAVPQRFEGTLQLAADGRSMTGEVRFSNGAKELLVLTRSR